MSVTLLFKYIIQNIGGEAGQNHITN